MRLRRVNIGLLLVLVALSGLWLLRRLQAPAPRPAAVNPVGAVQTATPGPSETPLHAPPGYRLAGVALGEPDSFAVIEAPDGSHALYHLDAEVAGLGRLVRIAAERVVVESEAGPFDLWLAPAATATPKRERTASHPAPTAMSTPRPAARGGTVGGSTPSAVPGRPAS